LGCTPNRSHRDIVECSSSNTSSSSVSHVECSSSYTSVGRSTADGVASGSRTYASTVSNDKTIDVIVDLVIHHTDTLTHDGHAETDACVLVVDHDVIIVVVSDVSSIDTSGSETCSS
jgi:hypothetical protein